MTSVPRRVEVRSRILRENDVLAGEFRKCFQQAGVAVISFVSSPGSGKTTLLESLMAKLATGSISQH
jgi:hydrogenase nickel incorporation protein HypB